MYLTIKTLHIGCVLLTFLSFFLRGVWMMQGSYRLQQRWVKIVPHLIDTVLLMSGISLAFILHLSPVTQTWLMAKLLALLFYIILGHFALKRGKTKTIRIMAWVSALGVFSYIVMVALKRVIHPWAWW